ncbi:MAG: hypothetical protein MK132_02920 [Lentisphaerales bacterium]|nr:hypothetical protein [Lentisphaerales bacterium]
MLLFLSRNRKLISLYFLGLFILSSNTYGDHLLTEAAKIVIGITIDDYKCKGSGCGCDTAFKCLTDCCCEVDEAQVVAIICNPVMAIEPEVKSCCSSEPEPKIFAENVDEIISKNIGNASKLLLPGRCSSEEFFSFQVSQGFLMDIMQDCEYSSEYLSETEWFSLEKFTPQTVTEDLLKVPILG